MARGRGRLGAWFQVSPRSLGENLAALASAQLLTWVITGATLAILPRYLGPTDFGRLTLGITLAAFASTFAGLGLPTLVTKLVARDGREAGDAVLTALVVTLVTSVLAAVGLQLALPVLGYEARTQAVVGLSLLVVPVVLAGMICGAILQGFEVMRVQALLDVGGKLGTLVALAVIIVTGTGVIAYATANAILTVAGAVPMIVVALRAIGIRGRRANRVREVVVGGLPLYTTDVFLVLYMTTDLVLLSLLATETDVGLYAAPMRIFATLLFLPNVVALVLFPRLAHAHRSDPTHFLTVSYWALVCVWLAAVPISLAGALLSGDGAVALFGHSFADSAAVSVALALSIVPTSLNVVLARVFIACDRQVRWTAIMAGALAAKIALNLSLIPLFERHFDNAALGAAVGLTLVEFGMTVAGLVAAPEGLRTRLLDHRGRRVIVSGVLAMAAFLVLLPVSAIAGVVVALAVYGVLVLAFGLAPRSREQLATPLRFLRQVQEDPA